MIRKLSILMAAAAAATSTGSAPASATPAKANETVKPTEPTTPAAAAQTSQANTAPAAAAAQTPANADPAAANQAAGAQPSGEVPSSTDPALAPVRRRAPKDPANQLNIINGRLPFPLVYAIRFQETGKPVGDTAKRYGTSVGKVFDINKGRNFGYIDANYKPSAEEMQQARNWVTTAKTAKGQTLKEAGGDPDGITALLDKMTVATNDEVAKRNWQTRVFGAATGNQAPTAPTAGQTTPAAGQTAGQTAPAEKPVAAKLF